jgi:hypothetical protein
MSAVTCSYSRQWSVQVLVICQWVTGLEHSQNQQKQTQTRDYDADTNDSNLCLCFHMHSSIFSQNIQFAGDMKASGCIAVTFFKFPPTLMWYFFLHIYLHQTHEIPSNHADVLSASVYMLSALHSTEFGLNCYHLVCARWWYNRYLLSKTYCTALCTTVTHVHCSFCAYNRDTLIIEHTAFLPRPPFNKTSWKMT